MEPSITYLHSKFLQNQTIGELGLETVGGSARMGVATAGQCAYKKNCV